MTWPLFPASILTIYPVSHYCSISLFMALQDIFSIMSLRGINWTQCTLGAKHALNIPLRVVGAMEQDTCFVWLLSVTGKWLFDGSATSQQTSIIMITFSCTLYWSHKLMHDAFVNDWHGRWVTVNIGIVCEKSFSVNLYIVLLHQYYMWGRALNCYRRYMGCSDYENSPQLEIRLRHFINQCDG
jgi:hypothetical protein